MTNLLQWRHNGHDGVSNHQRNDCLLNSSFRRRSKKTPKTRVAGLCDGIAPVTGEFPAERTSNTENASLWWRHHKHNDTKRYIIMLWSLEIRIFHYLSLENCLIQSSGLCSNTFRGTISTALALTEHHRNILDFTPECFQHVSEGIRLTTPSFMKLFLNIWDVIVILMIHIIHTSLTHWGRDKMDTFSSAFSWMKTFEFRLNFPWSLFRRVQSTIFKHWFR